MRTSSRTRVRASSSTRADIKTKPTIFPKQAVIISCAILGLVSMLICGYGYAALSTDLLISGEATIAQSGSDFTAKYMQDMTPEECEGLSNDATTQLIDKRDGKKYWVAKFRDGTCWMTQDLKFDIVADENGDIELTSELTDINPSPNNAAGYTEEIQDGQTILKWNKSSTFPPTATTEKGNLGSKHTTTLSIHLVNEFIIKKPFVSKSGVIDMTALDINNNRYWLYKPSNTALPSGISYDETTLTFDAHYLIGNYYQYNAATAGSKVKGEDAVSSICPKGWALPAYFNKDDPLSGFPLGTAKLYPDGASSGWPFYFSQASHYANSAVDSNNRTQAGFYWTRGALTGANNYIVRFYTPTSSIITSALKYETTAFQYRGVTVRCGLRMD